MDSGLLSREDGTTIQILVQQNTGWSPFAIDFIAQDGKRKPFFRAANPYEVGHEWLDTRFGIVYDME